jgi:hypothetical protein
MTIFCHTECADERLLSAKPPWSDGHIFIRELKKY